MLISSHLERDECVKIVELNGHLISEVEYVPKVIVKVDSPLFDHGHSNVDNISIVLSHLCEIECKLLDIY